MIFLLPFFFQPGSRNCSWGMEEECWTCRAVMKFFFFFSFWYEQREVLEPVWAKSATSARVGVCIFGVLLRIGMAVVSSWRAW